MLGLATAASAQSNQRDYGRPLDTPENRIDMAMRFAARCVVSDVPASARKVLATELGSKDEAKRVAGLVGVARACFQPQWPAFEPTSFRNAIAESFYRDSYLLKAPSVPVASGPPESFAVVPAGTTGTPAQEVAWQLAATARCVVFAAPEPSRQLVIGPRNVAEETRRYDLLRPALAKCVAASDRDVLTAANFRGFIATALLDRAKPATAK